MTFGMVKLNETGDMNTTGEEEVMTTFADGITLAIKLSVKPEFVYST